MYKILVINPGSTSTKIAVYHDDTLVMTRCITHTAEELSPFANVMEQFDFRKGLVLDTLCAEGVEMQFDAVIGRGGLLKPIKGGIYRVNDRMISDTYRPMRMHACNLGALIANDIASLCNSPAYIADPGVVDELADVARITGSAHIMRHPVWHALNHRAVARRYAAEHNTRYETLDLVICHIGGGISVAAHHKGKAVETNNALDGEGPFSPERAGTLPTGDLIDFCFGGHFTHAQMRRQISGHGGIFSHLGTTDVREVEKMMAAGNSKAKLILDAMIYQTARYIGAAATVLYGHVDAVIITGGVANSKYVVNELSQRISFIAPISVYPGEDEMQALAQNALGVLRGEMQVEEY